jgi:protein-tyrosine phosphatase
MINVLFVCLGNICRSPMAEAVFRNYVINKNLEDKINVDSAGTGNWHVGEKPHEGTMDLLERMKIDTSDLFARQLTENDLDDFQYIIAMDAENSGVIHRLAGYDKKVHIARLLDFVEGINHEDVPDPYFTGDFRQAFELINFGCKEFLSYLCENEGL